VFVVGGFLGGCVFFVFGLWGWLGGGGGMFLFWGVLWVVWVVGLGVVLFGVFGGGWVGVCFSVGVWVFLVCWCGSLGGLWVFFLLGGGGFGGVVGGVFLGGFVFGLFFLFWGFLFLGGGGCLFGLGG